MPTPTPTDDGKIPIIPDPLEPFVDPFGIIPGVPNGALANATGGLGGITGGISGLANALINPGFWLRIGIGYMGFVLIVFGLVMMIMSSRAGSTIKGAAKTAAMATPPTRAAAVAASAVS